MKKTLKKSTQVEATRQVVRVEAVDDDALVTVSGGRSYGWENGGWVNLKLRADSSIAEKI